ncbi:response regulator transcription factor [Egicoccus sp. AB-alg6-2]|uniref:response regulator transcription factor n=1 Tax=Egicoccus sp. AB-alg6-2 TaxID=3242692 RepID=UPI00359E6DD2
MRTLVIDDEPQVRLALRRGLELEGHEPVLAATGAEGLTLASTRRPDLVLLDLGLPDMDGVEVIRRLRGRDDTPIIILSMHGAEARKIEALDEGADDFITKPFGMGEVMARLRAVMRRTRPALADEALAFGRLRVDLGKRAVWWDDERLPLTPTEFDLLLAFVEQPGKLLTHHWLTTRLWGRSAGGRARQQLRVYVRQLRDKLGDDVAAPTFIATEVGVGYRWLREPDPTPEDDGPEA